MARIKTRFLALALVVTACGRTALYSDPSTVVHPKPAPQMMDPPPQAPTACITSTDAAVSWQRWPSANITCFGGMTILPHGAEAEYAFAAIPKEDDPGWLEESDPNISFNQKSRLCDPAAPCACSKGGDFTYFQTGLELKQVAAHVTVQIQNVDDGVEVKLFNTKHPDGVVGGNAFFPGGGTADFGSETVVGHNRVVLTHVDDCCSESHIDNAQLTVDGDTVTLCP